MRGKRQGFLLEEEKTLFKTMNKYETLGVHTTNECDCTLPGGPNRSISCCKQTREEGTHPGTLHYNIPGR